MKKIILTLILLLTASGCYSIGVDKYKHYGVSTVFGAASYYVVDKAFPNAEPWQKWIGAVTIAMIPGIAKEFYDSQDGGSRWDNQDLLADFLGASTVPTLRITWEF